MFYFHSFNINKNSINVIYLYCINKKYSQEINNPGPIFTIISSLRFSLTYILRKIKTFIFVLLLTISHKLRCHFKNYAICINFWQTSKNSLPKFAQANLNKTFIIVRVWLWNSGQIPSQQTNCFFLKTMKII